jgi:geranylgeranyl diphosphate synthase type II
MLNFAELSGSFEREFQTVLYAIRQKEPFNLYEPVTYSVSGGGKRIRPILLLHSASLFSKDIEHTYSAAAAIELFHNFTLLHDDIMDHAQIRRGVQAVHVKYGENSAILSGDAMSILAFQYLSASISDKLTDLLSLFSKTALEVCEGQQLDMEFETTASVSVEEYLEMIRLKTAVLIACSLKLGAILGGADETNCQLLYDFGINIGVAFQLQDDWLDVYGDENTFGKKIGGDICENKKTFLLLKALELSSTEDYSSLQDLLKEKDFSPEKKITSAREIFTRSGSSDATKLMMKHYHDQALKILELISVPKADKSELANFAASVLSRIS